VVVTRGGDGVSLFTGAGRLDLAAPRVQVADTIGAGDTFGAATLHALGERDLLGAGARARLRSLDHEDWREVLEYAARAAKKAAREAGMRFLRESAVEQVLAGVTTLREVNKVTFVE